ncbi:MAG: S-methyl-5-thioribose-1-phosphate isomerase, partial [Alphaproteobacteria bacterium]
MQFNGKHMRTIWLAEDGWSVQIIDQTKLPHVFETATLCTLDDAARAISDMLVRGAPLIGATAAYGVCLALREEAGDEALEAALARLAATRPTAVNLKWALREMEAAVRNLPRESRVAAAYRRAAEICDEDAECCRMIGVHGLEIIRQHAARKGGKAVNVLTHCNAGSLATIDWGTATSPLYQAQEEG